MEKLTEEQKNELKNKKSTMIKTLVLLEESLKKEVITNNFFLRLKSGIDFIITDCVKKLREEQNISLLTSELTFNKMARVSKISRIDKKDLRIYPFIKQEIEMLEKFEKHIAEQDKFTSQDFTALIQAQQKLDEKIFNKETN